MHCAVTAEHGVALCRFLRYRWSVLKLALPEVPTSVKKSGCLRAAVFHHAPQGYGGAQQAECRRHSLTCWCSEHLVQSRSSPGASFKDYQMIR